MLGSLRLTLREKKLQLYEFGMWLCFGKDLEQSYSLLRGVKADICKEGKQL
jgi:hypothetical protein